jgi:hypothetical protein
MSFVVRQATNVQQQTLANLKARLERVPVAVDEP